MIEIRQGSLGLIDQMSELFNQYRIFYGQKNEPEKAKDFLLERLKFQDSLIRLAFRQDTVVGFMQLYPCFSSVRLQPIYILNDLFVHQNYRNNGIGSALINEAKSICISDNIAGLQLETSKLNRANELYKKSGFSLIEDTNFYSWTAP
jgi:GNAT superfamily N-acetyltransferase